MAKRGRTHKTKRTPWGPGESTGHFPEGQALNVVVYIRVTADTQAELDEAIDFLDDALAGIGGTTLHQISKHGRAGPHEGTDVEVQDMSF